MANDMKTILVTGAFGQIGTELTALLRKRHGAERVVASDIAAPPAALAAAGPFERLDVTDPESVTAVVRRHKIDTIYHLAALLSAVGEKHPDRAWAVNMDGTRAVLEVARIERLVRVFVPSSIAVFGPATPRRRVPQDTVLDPRTMYGVTKVAGELLCDYYVRKFGVDVRGCRFPGIISHETPPGGGTTDYAVAIFYDAVKTGRYTCFLKEETRLPMMYMPDCLKSVVDLMDADFARLRHHANFNVTAMSFSAGELAAEIRRHIPAFRCDYAPDFRQAIAETWPESIDDSAARSEWDWAPSFDLAGMTADMIAALRAKPAGGRT
jgi:nucleoside-diphosphate-sugar epimerase